jgi:hypothetical protein
VILVCDIYIESTVGRSRLPPSPKHLVDRLGEIVYAVSGVKAARPMQTHTHTLSDLGYTHRRVIPLSLMRVQPCSSSFPLFQASRWEKKVSKGATLEWVAVSGVMGVVK